MSSMETIGEITTIEEVVFEEEADEGMEEGLVQGLYVSCVEKLDMLCLHAINVLTKHFEV